MLRTLRHPEFRRLWIGQSISMVGDGIYFVALPWQVYEISNAPTALAERALAGDEVHRDAARDIGVA